jgi:hypothetical protein
LSRSVENPWVKKSLKKMVGKNKWKGGKVFIELLGGVFSKGLWRNPEE